MNSSLPLRQSELVHPVRRPKTADQSYLEFEKKKFAEEAERKEAEVKQKIELLDQVRKLEAKTQALNEMALSVRT
ncbi:hypothetical protein KEM48_010601 [Puccinia striiformis f. sp. tritici PST-130]|nr:hypothetical protein KEM48_010601 [Puccinia striiformis f. sp. tritici PST-130]